MAGSTRKRTNSGRKKTTGRSNTKRKTTTKRSYSMDINENGLWDEAILLLLMALAVILLLSNFGAVGTFGKFLSDVMFGLFGLMSFLFPICLLILLVYLYAKRNGVVSIIKIAASVVMFVDLCVLSHLMILDKQISSGNNPYKYCLDHKMGGGLLGGFIANVFVKLISMAGTVILFLILALICFMLITEISLIDQVRTGSRKAVDMTKEDAIRYRERKRERDRIRKIKEAEYEREKEERRRQDKKVLGVSLDTAISKTAETEYAPNSSENFADYTEDLVEKELQINNSDNSLTYDNEIIAKEPISDFVEYIEPENEDYDENVENDQYNREITPDILNETEFNFANINFDSIPGYDEEILPSVKMEPQIEDSYDDEIVIEPEIEKEIPKSVQVHENISDMVVKKPTAIKPSEKSELFKAASGNYENKNVKKKKYVFPSINLLNNVASKESDSAASLEETANKLVATLESFNVSVTKGEKSRGPSVTRFEMIPAPGVKVSKILGLSDDIKLALAAADVRIEAPIPGKSAIGIEVPNANKTVVSFKEMMASKEFKNNPSKICFGLGKDIAGKPVVADIAKMPHLLIAGATGSGKSVCINTIIMSILYKADPEEVKLIMIDPKVVELSVYNGIPHLMIPVVTDPKKATAALAWGVNEMTERYEKFANFGVRDLKGYNSKIEKMNYEDNDGAPLKKLPQIVIIVDELADLMMVASKEVEEHICRLAQLARACGIHLVIATQRPSVDVITGLIKANMPSRIAFAVSSGIDSRTILDTVGAEKLLGKGDMLYYPQGFPKPARIQGAFVSDEEVMAVVEDITAKNSDSFSDEQSEILSKMSALESTGSKESSSGSSNAAIDDGTGHDPLFVEVAKFVIESNKATIGGLQRKFKIGFNRAARIVDDLSDNGILGPEAGTKPREILMSMEEFEQWVEEYL